MEFQTTRTQVTPKNLYPCLATITVVPHGTDTWTRRLSAASFGSGSGDDGNVLTRVISGGRRKTSFGHVGDRGDRPEETRRRSFTGKDGAAGGSAVAGGEEISGKWYWRVQAGATDQQLVLLPLTSPANPVLTSPPQPLSHAMPSHSVNPTGATGHDQGQHGHETHEGLGTKIKNLFRRSSTSHEQKPADAAQQGAQGGQPGQPGQTGVLDQSPHAGTGNDATSQATATTATAVDRVLDQTPQGEMLPSAQANATGATNVNANAETGWPGVINGQPLASVVVDLHSIDKHRITIGGGKKHEGSWVIVHVSFNPQHNIDPIGKTHFEAPKSGTIKFEFDKDWIGAKGEAELLHHYITTAVQNLPAQAEHGAERAFPQSTNFQLGGQQHGATGNTSSALGAEVAPDQRA